MKGSAGVLDANVLFVCSGNSCRSQLAKGWLRALGAGRFAVKSAGISQQVDSYVAGLILLAAAKWGLAGED